MTLDVDFAAVAGERLAQGALIDAADVGALALEVSTSRPRELRRARVLVDSEDLTETAEWTTHGLRVPLADLPDGSYEAHLVVPRGFPFAQAREAVTFTIDATPPRLRITRPRGTVWLGQPTTLAGTVEAGSRAMVDGEAVVVRGGRFEVSYPAPPHQPVMVQAIDVAGNTTEVTVTFEAVPPPPRRPAVGPVRGVHVTAYAWATPSLREPVLDMVRAGLINTVELDLKDESGIVGYSSQVPLAREIGAARGIYDLHAAVAELHELGVHVIGRLVAFRDPVLAGAAWERGQRDVVLQRPDGTPYAGYGGFTNFAHPVVRAYNIDIAREAAEAGVDDILYDYIRRPDGPLENLLIPGLDGTPEDAIAQFLAESRAALADTGTFLGASVYGIASTRPRQIAQDIPAIAAHVDYVAPMVYPSHWARGEYGVGEPNRQPYEIVLRSLPDFQRAVEGTQARVVPWLQDFSLGVRYGPSEVRAQILAARDVGIDEWLLWNPLVRYTRAALEEAPRIAAGEPGG